MALEYFDLGGRTALVTGGASGLGLGMGRALAKAGASVAIADIHEANARAAAGELRREGASAVPLMVDVADARQVERMTAEALQVFGQIDVLVCAAGLALRKTAEETSEAEFDRLLAVNFKGVFLCNTVVGRHMIERRRGTIINIASQGAFSALDGRPVYCASKAAVAHFTKALALDWAKHGVRVNAIAPGLMVTPMTEEVRRDEARIRRYLARIPAGRLGVPEDLAGLTVFLASDAARYVVGQTIIVDGGWTIS